MLRGFSMATWMVLLKHISGPIQPMESKKPNNHHKVLSAKPYFSGVNFQVVIIVIFFLAVGLSGCVTMADPEASQVYSSDSVGILSTLTEIGQSFISRRPDLNAITLWLTYSENQNGEISPSEPNYIDIKLYLNPEKPVLVYAASVIAPSSGVDLPISINIPDQYNQPNQAYYLLLSKDQGSIGINGRNEDAYPDGQAYLNGNPIDADIAFRLNYDYDLENLLGDLKGFISKICIVIPLMIILWLPGWLMLEFTGFHKYFDLGEQTAMAIGFSLVSIPVIMLWTTIVKIRWTSTAVYFIAGFLVALFILRLLFRCYSVFKHRKRLGDNLPAQNSSSFRSYSWKSFGQFAILILIFCGTLAVRLIMVRDLATPAWVDSVHHALITRLIMENGAYPSSYLPYLDISPSAYHPGFHSIAATFTWLSKLDIDQCLLILGQVLNALSIFTVYLFTKILTRRSTAGLFAAIITGFITPMPAYYTSWGRYTELTGLLVMPVVLAMLQIWLDRKKNVKSPLIILFGAISLGGLFMLHYRVIAFFVALLFAYVVVQILPRRSLVNRKTTELILLIALISILGIVFVFPWFLQTLKTTVLPIVTTPFTSIVGFFQDFSWPYLTSALGKQSLALAGLGLCWSAIKRQRFAFILLIWVFIMFFFANMASLKIPGGGLISNASVEIMLFIPISLLGGYFVDQVLIHWKVLLPKKLLAPAVGIIIIFMGFACYLGAKQLIPIINPITILSRSADLPAIQWISDNIPMDETIIINPFSWGYGLYGGSDGGYWISPLSGRQTIPPPVLYGLSIETGSINQLSQEIISQSPDPASFRDFLLSENYHYVYTGAKGGVIPPEKLVASGLFTALYHQDGVWILRIKP
jgi:hypothetical protein